MVETVVQLLLIEWELSWCGVFPSDEGVLAMKTGHLVFATTMLAGLAVQPAAAQSADLQALQQRLDALEDQVQQLEARNLQLEADNDAGKKKMSSMMMADKEAGIPVLTSYAKDGKTVRFSFKPRATLELDYAGFVSREGGFDYNNGTTVRRGRIGLEGTAFTDWRWRIEADFNNGQGELTDIYLQYAGFRNATITMGQYKMPYTLEGTGSDNYNTFLERGFFVNAFESLAGRRIGVGTDVVAGPFNIGLAISGDNNSVTRDTLTAADPKVPDESVGLHGRITYETKLNKVGLHLGASGYWRGDLNQDTVRFGDRPGSRVDNTRILDTGSIRNVSDAYFLGGEAIAAYGPFSVQGEYGKTWLSRKDTLSAPGVVTAVNPDYQFEGYYVFASWMITGESRPFKNGTLDRIRPKASVGEGGLGAFELAFRYDHLDLSDAKAGHEATSYTTALNWYFTPNMKLMFNWMRFDGVNTPLDPIGNKTKGDLFSTRVHVDF